MKRLPVALVLGLAIQLVFDSARIVHWLAATGPDSWARWELLESGFNVATAALIASGLFELARGLRDRAALGARIAGWTQITQLVIAVLWIGFAIWSEVTQKGMTILEDTMLVSQYVQSLITLGMMIGVALAMRTVVLGSVGVVVAVVGVPLPVLGNLYRKAFDFENSKAGVLVTLLPYVLVSAIALAQLWVGAAAVELPQPATSANAAFTNASKALWLRVISALSLAGITLLGVAGGGQGLLGLYKAVTLLAPIVDAIALAMFARAALQLSRTQLAPWLTAAGGALALWATGAITGRIGSTYQLLYGSGYSRHEDKVSSLYMTLVPLISGAGITLVLMSVAKLARTRNRDEVRENVAVRTGVFVALTLAVLFVVNYGLEKIGPESAGLAIFALLAIACAGLYSQVLAAKICTQGAELVEGDPIGLPAATLVKGGDA